MVMTSPSGTPLASRIGRLLRITAWVAGVMVAIMPPMLTWGIKYLEIQERAQRDAEVQADLLGHFAVRFQERWAADGDALKDALFGITSPGLTTQIQTLDGRLMTVISGNSQWPTQQFSREIRPHGQAPVGRVVVVASLRPAMEFAFWVAEASFLLALLIVIPLSRYFLRHFKQTAAELEFSESRFRDLSTLSSDWFWEQDADLRFTFFSSSSDPAKFDFRENIGKKRWDLPIDLTPEEWAAHRAVLDARQPFREFEYAVRRPEGIRYWSVSGMPLYDAAGRFTGYRGTTRDVTDRRRMEDELRKHRDHLQDMVDAQTHDLRRAKEAAEQANRAKSEFLANMSHELRTPLHAMLSFARLGHDKAGDAPAEKLRTYFGNIHTSGDRMLELVNDLLDLSRLEAGRMELSMGTVDLVSCANEVVAELAPLCAAKSLRCQITLQGSSGRVLGDRQRIVQVMVNLLGNAIKFSPPERLIEISIDAAVLPSGRRANDQGTVSAARLTVCDSGPGIPPDELDSIFDKFTQSSRTNQGAGGSGLGLAICREIVLAHRGEIRARNRPADEGGAIFDVLLPIAQEVSA